MIHHQVAVFLVKRVTDHCLIMITIMSKKYPKKKILIQITLIIVICYKTTGLMERVTTAEELEVFIIGTKTIMLYMMVTS